LINQYPMVSQTFIRREIQALEKQGFDILRIALQKWDSELVDEDDKREMSKTRYVLPQGGPALIQAVIRTILLNPIRFFTALLLAIKMMSGSERKFYYHLIYLTEACQILIWLKSFGALHLHAHFGNNSAEVAMLVNALGGPQYSFTLHGQNELLFGGTGEKIRRAAFVVAISSYGRSQLYRRVEYAHWSKIKVVHCGLDTLFYEHDPVLPAVTPRLVCVARLCEAKGQMLLIEAVHSLAQKGITLELVFAGDGEMRKQLEALISRYKLNKQIRITGWLSGAQVREEILASRGLVLPSFSEGLPIVIMEAMSLRRPVLSTYVAGIPELVQPGITGWLFPAGSIDDMTLAFEDFLSKTVEELKVMGDAAYTRVLERHSIDIESAKLAELFRETCQ